MRYREGKPAVSSVVGSLFFVLIMIVSMGALASIFNSFTAYNNTVNKVGNSQVQADNTLLSVSGSSFGAFPPSTTSNFNVATACSTTSTSPTNQNKLFFAAGMWWDFFTCNANFQYSTSFDGVTWEAETTIPSLVAGYTVGPYFDIQVVDSTIYLVIAKLSNARFQLGIGTLASGGTMSAPAGTITWTSAPAEVTTTANALGPIQIEADGAGNRWVAVVQGATAIAIYEHQTCATASNTGWEPNACDSATAPTNYAPTASPNLGALAANANMMIFPPPSDLASVGAILLYETGSATVPSTGTVAVITQTALASTAWNQITLSGITAYSLTASSALFIGSTMYFAGLQNAATGQTTGNLKFWTLTLTSMAVGTNTAEQTIESSTLAWQAALTYSGTTLALFDNPSSSTIQYYTSSTLGSIWNSPAITLESAETAINGLSPASGAFAVTWANAAPNIRFAALSTFTVTNNSPFAVHVVDLYVYNPATNSLVAHYYINSTQDFDYWVGQGSTMVVPIRFIWTATTSYLVTVGTDTGVTTQLTVTSPPVATITCPAGTFVSQTEPTQTCSSVPPAASPKVTYTSNANTCTDTTSGATRMMGLGVSYTTDASSSGNIYVILTFDARSPAVSNINSKWQLAYGTGTAPACNAAATGTTRGQQYTINTEAAVVLEMGQSVGVTITGLSPSTTYWFDIQVLDSTAGAWVYSLPALSVTDILTSGLQAPQVGSDSNTNTCTISSVSTLMGGFGTTYTTGGSSFQGDLYLTLSFDVRSPATSAINSQWRIAYGTGTAPACGAAAAGTTVGNQYQVVTEAAVVLEMGQSESVVITGLAASTTYWFDVQITDSTTGSWVYSKPTLAVVEIPATKNLPPNVNFNSNANSCGRNTAANAMAGFGTTYTTLSSGTGSVFVSLTFKVASPATSNLNSRWQVAYGTGTPPACNAAATGALVGRQYTINTEAAVAGGMGQTSGFVITGLSKGTLYWIDVQVTDSSAAVWTYSNPAIAVMEIMPADFVHSNTVFSSNAISCGRNTNTNLMAGFGTTATATGVGITYTTTSFGSGNVQVVLTFNLASPGTNNLNTQWRVAYGTGAAPACNGAATGTTVGNLYTWGSTSGTAGGSGQSVGFTVVGLTPATAYWFDVQALDSTNAVWTYSNPEITVVELP